MTKPIIKLMRDAADLRDRAKSETDPAVRAVLIDAAEQVEKEADAVRGGKIIKNQCHIRLL